MTQAQIEQLTAEEYSEFIIDGEVEAEEPDLIKMLEFDGSEQMIEVVYEANCCLLYTSPSPRDFAISRMPSSA